MPTPTPTPTSQPTSIRRLHDCHAAFTTSALSIFPTQLLSSHADAPRMVSAAPPKPSKAPQPARYKPSTRPHTPPPTVPLRRKVTPPPLPGQSTRFLKPAPPPLPHELYPAGRGRNARLRSRQAEYFRRYIYLRKVLKPWSDNFRQTHGRTPSMADVHDAHIPGLFDRFVEYIDALEGVRTGTCGGREPEQSRRR